MFANVAEKIEHINVGCPIQVVHHQRRVIAVKINKLADLLPYFLDPAPHDLGRIQLSLRGLEAGVTNQTRRATHQCNGAVAGLLKAPQYKQRDQRTNVQTIRSGIKATVEGARLCGEPLHDRILTRNLENQVACAQVIK